MNDVAYHIIWEFRKYAIDVACDVMWSSGGGWYVGKALSLALGAKGIFVTVVDFSEEKGREVASQVEKENAKFHSKLEFPSALFIKCDVTNSSKWNNICFWYMISYHCHSLSLSLSTPAPAPAPAHTHIDTTLNYRLVYITEFHMEAIKDNCACGMFLSAEVGMLLWM